MPFGRPGCYPSRRLGHACPWFFQECGSGWSSRPGFIDHLWDWRFGCGAFHNHQWQTRAQGGNACAVNITNEMSVSCNHRLANTVVLQLTSIAYTTILTVKTCPMNALILKQNASNFSAKSSLGCNRSRTKRSFNAWDSLCSRDRCLNLASSCHIGKMANMERRCVRKLCDSSIQYSWCQSNQVLMWIKRTLSTVVLLIEHQYPGGCQIYIWCDFEVN